MRPVMLDVQGERLSVRIHEPDGARAPKGGLVLLHGFQSSSREFGSAPEILATHGFRVATVDFRGHGESEGARGVLSRARCDADARAAASFLASETPGTPLGLIGHSLGGAMAISVLATDSPFTLGATVCTVDSLIAEANAIERWMYPHLVSLSDARRARGKGPIVMPYRHANNYGVLFADKRLARAAKKDPFLLKNVDLTHGADLMAVEASAWARDVRVPMLTVLAKRDEVVKNAATRRVHDALPNAKRLIELDSGHSAFMDRARDALIASLVEWFDEGFGHASVARVAERA